MVWISSRLSTSRTRGGRRGTCAFEDVAATERDKLIIRVLADTGARVGELLGLQLNDLVERNRNHYLRVRGKGDKERLVPIPGNCQ